MELSKKIIKAKVGGVVACHSCSMEVACKLLDKHIEKTHPQLRGLCSFCGVHKLQYNASGLRILPASKEHLLVCIREAKRLHKSKQRQREDNTQVQVVYATCECVSTKFVIMGGSEKETAVDSVVLKEQCKLDAALEMRCRIFSGEMTSKVATENIRTPDADRVRAFFDDDDAFKIPAWCVELSERFSDRIIANRLEYHHSYNIDTFWARVYGLKELEFYHVFVHMCIFEKFCATVRRHRDKCTLVRYACMCDKHDRVHAHFVLVALCASKIQRYFNNGNFQCEITEERQRLAKRMKVEQMKIVPAWPDHRHFHMKAIVSGMHLFNTFKYISTRHSTTGMKTTTAQQRNSEAPMYELLNVATSEQYELQRQVDALIKRYVTNQNYTGSHFYIMRPLSDDAPMWFCAVSRNGLYAYVSYLMDKRSVIDVLDKVEISKTQNCSLQFRHIMGNLSQYAIPLRHEDFLYHSSCNNKKISVGRRDLNRYIHLGRHEYMFLANGTSACCEEYAKDIFFANQPTSSYIMTHKQNHEYTIYNKWTSPYETKITNIVNEWQAKFDEMKASFEEKITSLQIEIALLRELRTVDKEKAELVQENVSLQLRCNDYATEIEGLTIELGHTKDSEREQCNTSAKLRNQLAHMSLAVATKSGPYLASNENKSIPSSTFK